MRCGLIIRNNGWNYKTFMLAANSQLSMNVFSFLVNDVSGHHCTYFRNIRLVDRIADEKDLIFNNE